MNSHDERMKKVMLEKHEERQHKKKTKSETSSVLQVVGWIVLICVIPFALGLFGFPQLVEGLLKSGSIILGK